MLETFLGISVGGMLIAGVLGLIIVGYVNFFAFQFQVRHAVTPCLTGEEQVRLAKHEDESAPSWATFVATLVLAPMIGLLLANKRYRQTCLRREVEEVERVVCPCRESSVRLLHLPRQVW